MKNKKKDLFKNRIKEFYTEKDLHRIIEDENFIILECEKENPEERGDVS